MPLGRFPVSKTALSAKQFVLLSTLAVEDRSVTMAKMVYAFSTTFVTKTKKKKAKTSRRKVKTHVSVYPNPAQDELLLNSNNSAVEVVPVEVYDLFSRKVLQQTMNQSSGIIRLNELPQEIYILKVMLN